MSLSEIYFNYSEAVKQANQLDGIAAKLDQQVDSEINEILSSIKNAWESDNSDRYLKKGQKVQSNVKTTAGNLRNIADTIRRIARKIRDAELEAWRIANENRQD